MPPLGSRSRRTGYAFLCVLPFLVVVLAMRALRIPGVHQTIGLAAFVSVCVAAWSASGGLGALRRSASQTLAAAGLLLMTPFALFSLLWVGLAAPWDATAAENQMRYVVLLAGSIAVTSGLVLLQGALRSAGECLYSGLGLSTSVLAGAAYLVWLPFQIGAWTARLRSGQAPAFARELNDALDTLLFVACVLTYLATAAFAMSLGRARWLSRTAASAYAIVSVAALGFVALRGLSFPDPTAGAPPWYALPGFIAGIPAVPWIMPHLLGALLLWRAGDEQQRPSAAPADE